MNGIIHPCTHSDDGSVVRMTQEMMFLAIGNFVDKLSMASTIQHIPTCKPRGNSHAVKETASYDARKIPPAVPVGNVAALYSSAGMATYSSCWAVYSAIRRTRSISNISTCIVQWPSSSRRSSSSSLSTGARHVPR